MKETNAFMACKSQRVPETLFEASKSVSKASKSVDEAFCCFFKQKRGFAQSIFTIPSIDYLNFFFTKIQFYG